MSHQIMEFEDFRNSAKIYGLLEHLKTSKSLIRMKLLGTDFEQQTVVEEIRKKGDMFCFIIECPKEVVELLGKSSRQFQCEFVGADKLPYFFHADISHIYQDNIWVLFPNLIRRKQLRRNYRVNAPSGTQMFFKKNGQLMKNHVINLSLGGSFGVLVEGADWSEKSQRLSVGDNITDIEVVFRSKYAEQRVSIRKAIVVRCEDDKESGCYACAVNFLDLDKVEEKALTELIYVIQRENLKKRPFSI